MSGLKRLCQAVFSLVTLAVLAALALTWFGPWTREASSLFVIREYVIAVLACVAVSAVGSVVLLVSALVSRKVRTVEVAQVDGGKISITRDAIAAQAAHIVEADGACTAARVHVDAKPHGHVRVSVRVLPRETVDVVAKGAELHEELLLGLATVCGDKVEDVSLEFVEPESVTLAATGLEPAAEESPELAGSGTEPAAAPTAADFTSEIRLPMGTGAPGVSAGVASAHETAREA